jgi:hypothetical protein
VRPRLCMDGWCVRAWLMILRAHRQHSLQG